MKTLTIVSNQVANGISAARRELNLLPARKFPCSINPGGDNAFRATFSTGDVAEINTRQHARTEIVVVQ